MLCSYELMAGMFCSITNCMQMIEFTMITLCYVAVTFLYIYRNRLKRCDRALYKCKQIVCKNI